MISIGIFIANCLQPDTPTYSSFFATLSAIFAALSLSLANWGGELGRATAWSQAIFKELGHYAPADLQGMRNLQETLAKDSSLEHLLITLPTWLVAEESALLKDKPQVFSPAREDFLDKSF